MTKLTKDISILGAISPTTKTATDIMAALTPPERGAPGALNKLSPQPPHKSLTDVAKMEVPGLVGAAAGFYLWKKHRVLGLFGGHAAASVGWKLFKGGDKTEAATQLAVTGAAIVGSLKSKKHPIIGWFVGALIGGVATSFVPGSAANDFVARMRR